MTALAIGQTTSVKLLDDGTLTIASNGGMGNVNIVTNLGITRDVGFGPSPTRRVFGPYKEGATVTVFNQSCDSLDYEGYLVDGGGFVVSPAAPNNADGRPDGTVYIQSAS